MSTQARQWWARRRAHVLEACEAGVGLERLCKSFPSLGIEVVAVQTAREGCS